MAQHRHRPSCVVAQTQIEVVGVDTDAERGCPFGPALVHPIPDSASERPERRVRLEASGGLTIETAREVGQTGVDLIAVGELTHSAPILDVGLDLQEVIDT